jgi:hypothetical protein
MKESFTHTAEVDARRPERLEKYLALAQEMSQNETGYAFPGIDSEWHEKLKAVDEEYPGYTTPTDEIIERMKKEGIKVVFGTDPKNGSVYLLPRGSNDIGQDMLLPKHLEVFEGMDESLRILILASKNHF